MQGLDRPCPIGCARPCKAPDAQAHRHLLDPHRRGGADHHRAGVRVRLFRHPGVQGPAGRGLPHRPGELEPRDHHDRPGHGGRDLRRADHPGDRRQDHREGASRRDPADHGRADGAQLRPVAAEDGRAGEIRRADDRRDGGSHRQGRGSPPVPRGDDPDRPRHAEISAGQRLGGQEGRPREVPRRGRRHRTGERRAGAAGRGAQGVRAEVARGRIGAAQALRRARHRPGADRAGRGRSAGDHPPLLHDGRDRRRHRLQPRGILGDRRARHRRLADQRGPDRGIGARLEGVRDGGGPRPRGQLHHRLLDREHRPDGRAHRRLDHRRPGADAHRQGISGDARRLVGGSARDRRRDRRLERAVRDRPRHGPHDRHRDEPARLALLRAGLEGHGLPARQGRGHARGGLHPPRLRHRHHRRRAAGLVRADHRLRCHEDPTLRLREVSRGRADPDHRDEVGGRSHGDRPLFFGVAAEGAQVPRDRPHGTRRDRDRRVGPRRRSQRDQGSFGPADAGPAPEDRPGAAARPYSRGSPRLVQGRPVVPGADPGDRRSGGPGQGPRPARHPRRLPPTQGRGFFRRAARRSGQAGGAGGA